LLRRCFDPLRILSVAVLLAFASGSHAATITILDVNQFGTTVDGTIFEANPNPTSPSTGTGVFEPFVRIQANGSSQQSLEGNGNVNGNSNRNGQGSQNTQTNSQVQGLQRGFNTDAKEPGINFDTKGGLWTHSITLGDVGTVTRGGIQYLEFSLDSAEPGAARKDPNLIDITDVQLFLGPGNPLANPEAHELGTIGQGGLLQLGSDADLIWRLDDLAPNGNGDVTVRLAASICDAPGQCGNGHGDMTLLIPVSALDLPAGWSLNDNLVFYTEYTSAGGSGSSFEEWRYGDGPPIPEPNAALVFSVGALIVGGATRWARRQQG